MKRTVQCPSCGSPVELAFRSVRVVTCPACDTVSAIENDQLDPTGKTVPLVDFMSALTTGARGTMGGRGFVAMGRVRYEYSDGYWDEWFLLFEDGTDGWLHEDEGELTVISKQPLVEGAPARGAVGPGERFSLGERSVYVTERGEATIAGVEGQLPRGIRVGQSIHYIDGVDGDTVVMLEYTDDEVELFTGRELDPDDLVLD